MYLRLTYKRLKMKSSITNVFHLLFPLWIALLFRKGVLGACEKLCTQLASKDCDHQGVILVTPTHVFYCVAEKGPLCVCPCVIRPQWCTQASINLQRPLPSHNKENQTAENDEWTVYSLINSQALRNLEAVRKTLKPVHLKSTLHKQNVQKENKKNQTDVLYSTHVVHRSRTLLDSDSESEKEEEPEHGHVNQKQNSRPVYYTGPARGPLPRAGAFALDDDWKPRRRTKLLNDPSPFPGSAIAVLVLLIIIVLLVIALIFYS